jgi:hypothetical protein
MSAVSYRALEIGSDQALPSSSERGSLPRILFLVDSFPAALTLNTDQNPVR